MVHAAESAVEDAQEEEGEHDEDPQVEEPPPVPPLPDDLPPLDNNNNSNNNPTPVTRSGSVIRSQSIQQPADVLSPADGLLLFTLPKLCKFFSEQKRPMGQLARLVKDIRDPVIGVPTTKKLIGLSRVAVFSERDTLHWIIEHKITAAASNAARLFELLLKDYVITEVKKGLFRLMDDDERRRAREEEEKRAEQKVQERLAALAKDQKKGKKQGVVYTVIGVELATLMASQKAEFPTLDVPYLLVRFAADVIALKGQQEEGIFRLSVGTEEVAQMVHQINSDNNYALVRRDPNVAAVMMKRYLRDLPQPLCPDYDEAIALVKKEPKDDAGIQALYDSLPEANRNVIKFIANFIYKMTRPEVVAATRMDVNNYAIVFTPGVLRSASVDLSAMANQQFEQEFTVRMMTQVRSQFPDDSVGTPESVPQPVSTSKIITPADVRDNDTPAPTPEDLVRQAEERLKNAQRDLQEAKTKEQKGEKKGLFSMRATSDKTDKKPSAASTTPIKDPSSLGKKSGASSLRGTTSSPAKPAEPVSPPPTNATPPSAAARGGKEKDVAKEAAKEALRASLQQITLQIGEGTPPKPRRAAPSLGGGDPRPDLPPLPPEFRQDGNE